MENDKTSANLAVTRETSYFDGGFFGLFGRLILAGFVTLITLGIAFPWMCCMLERWKAKHTVVCSKRMYFDGKGIQLVGKFILWGFLTIITFGIYGFWMSIAIKKWITKHTHFEGSQEQNSYFDGTIWGLIGHRILSALLFIFTLGIGSAWCKRIMLSWETKHTVVDSRRLIFNGAGVDLFGRYIIWGFLSIITLSIFSWWIPLKFKKWTVANITDVDHNAPISQKGKAGLIILAILGILIILALIFGAVAMFMERPAQMIPANLEGILTGQSANIDDNTEQVMESVVQQDEFSVEGSEDSAVPEEVILSSLTYDEFLARLKANLEDENLYNEITLLDQSERGDHYALICTAYYYESYFDLYVKHYNGYVASVEIDGPRVYETIDEDINGQEFQFLLKRMYEVLNIGPNGEEGGVFIKIDPGTNGVQPFIGWEYCHNHTEDNLNTIIKATEE